MINTFMFQDIPDTSSGGGSAIGGIIGGVVYLAVLVLMVAGLWKIFAKAGQPGWACIVPIYNLLTMLKIAGKPAWWIILFLCGLAPIMNIIVSIEIAKRFGKGVGFGLGMAFLGPIFIPMLGFGSATYQGPALQA